LKKRDFIRLQASGGKAPAGPAPSVVVELGQEDNAARSYWYAKTDAGE